MGVLPEYLSGQFLKQCREEKEDFIYQACTDNNHKNFASVFQKFSKSTLGQLEDPGAVWKRLSESQIKINKLTFLMISFLYGFWKV